MRWSRPVRLLAGGLLPLALSAEAAAASEFDSAVPVELARAFSNGSFYSDMPPGFPPFAMPAGLAPIGSMDSPAQQLVLLRANAGGEESKQALVAALMAGGGWIELPAPGAARQYGFVVPARPLEPVTLCHDEHGELEIRPEEGIENRVYLRRFVFRMLPERPTCAQQLEMRTLGRPMMPVTPVDISRYLPAFDSLMPATAAASAVPGPPLNAPALGIRGVPGNGAIVSTFNSSVLGVRGIPAPVVDQAASGRFLADPVRLQSNMAFIGGSGGIATGLAIPAEGRSLRRMRRLVEVALEEQGWKRDSEWRLADSAGSQWLRETDEGKRLLLMLRIARDTGEFYNLSYELSALGN